MRPLIGIPACLDERGRWKPGREYHYAHAAYARALERCGAAAAYLPPQADAAELAVRIDGLLIPGGGDFAPPRDYPPDVHFDVTPERQLAFDGALLDAALAREIPVLAICYGMQLLTLRHGGALVYDIASDLPRAVVHGGRGGGDGDARHALRVEPGTQLAGALEAAPGPVNSRHHQAVADPGRGLRVCARAEDGLIEAVERPAGAFCIGVQWHPEGLDGVHREGLFGAFVAACREARS